MHARVMHVTLKKDKIEAAMADWPTYTAQFKDMGLQAGYMLVDRETGKVQSVTIWDSEESIRRQEANPAFKGAIDHFRAYFAAEPSSSYYVVGASVE